MKPARDFNETKLHVARIYLSKERWFSDIEDTVFERIDVSFTHLSDWMIQDNSSNDMMRISKDSADAYNVNFHLRGLTGSPYDNARIRIWVAANTTKRGRTETSVQHEFRCTIEPQNNLQFDSISPLFEFYLPKFLNVATGFANFPLKIIGYGDRSDLSSGAHVYYRIPGFVDSRVSIMGGQMLFAFKDVKGKIAEYLAVWINNGESDCGQYMIYIPSHITGKDWKNRPNSWT